MKAMSLFASGGIGETYLHNLNIKTVIANELLKDRAKIYQFRFPETKIIQGDIKEKKQELVDFGKKSNLDLLIATPPCQGMSTLGKRDYLGDERNYLIFDVFDIIDALNFNYIFIENVPKFLKMYYPYKGKILQLPEILKDKYGNKYEIKCEVYNASDFGVPQRRKRAIIRLYKKGLTWNTPTREKHKITLREAIGTLPSLEAGEDSGIKWHKAPPLRASHVEMLQHTPTGKSAFDNEFYYPKRIKDGVRIKGFKDTYRRLDWDNLCPTRTMNSGNIGGSNNCHPGRLLPNGLYSDARVLTLLELFIVSSLPTDIEFPSDITENKIREIVGEGVPPKMVESFLREIV